MFFMFGSWFIHNHSIGDDHHDHHRRKYIFQGVDHLKLDQVKKNGERHCKKWKFSHQTQVASAKTNSLLLKMAIRIHLLR